MRVGRSYNVGADKFLFIYMINKTIFSWFFILRLLILVESNNNLTFQLFAH